MRRLLSTMAAWEPSSVTSLYTEPSAVSPPPAARKVTAKGAFLAVLATQKSPFKRHFQQPDKACAPVVMPKRRAATAASKVSSTRPTSDTATVTPPPSQRRRQSRSPPANQPHPIPLIPHTRAGLLLSQPRVDRYRSLMTVQSAFAPLPSPYYATDKTRTEQGDPDPALTPRLSNTRKTKTAMVTNSVLSKSHSESSTETPKLDNASRRRLTFPVNPYDDQLVFIGEN